MKKRIDHYASFKDPAAKVFTYNDEPGYIFRELDPAYLPHFNHFKSSGLSSELHKKNWLIPFKEVNADAIVFLKANEIPFVSYPYEWSFNQWKDAALLTLKIQFQALKYGMILKDATPFNIVYDGCRPVFVDVSSFEIYQQGSPWHAFKQFCENFYIPILLNMYFDDTGNEIYINHLSGIPINKGLALLPAKALFNFNTLLYLLLPEKIRSRSVKKNAKEFEKAFTAEKNLRLAEDMFSSINKLRQKKQQTKWNDYYEKNIDAAYLTEKQNVVKDWIGENYHEKSVVDFGCNTGNFSKIIAASVKKVIAFDGDARSVDELYMDCRQNKIENIFSFKASISEPTPAVGWNNEERLSLNERIKTDVGMALALVHHLAISNYIQFNKMAEFFADCCNEMLVEFVPKEDEKVQLLLANRVDIFPWYCIDNFLLAFKQKFELINEHRFSNNRILFHFKKA